jgi:hypothetical protein
LFAKVVIKLLSLPGSPNTSNARLVIAAISGGSAGRNVRAFTGARRMDGAGVRASRDPTKQSPNSGAMIGELYKMLR